MASWVRILAFHVLYDGAYAWPGWLPTYVSHARAAGHDGQPLDQDPGGLAQNQEIST